MQYLQANGAEIPLLSNCVDRIISINMFYHFSNPDSVLADMGRVLKYGGRLAIDDWFLTRKALTNTRALLQQEWSSPEGFHNYQRVKRLCRKNGLRIVGERDLTEAGKRYLNEEYFGSAFENEVRPLIREHFPKIYQYEGYLPEHADMAADQLKQAVLLMGDLYRRGEAVYMQFVAEKA